MLEPEDAKALLSIKGSPGHAALCERLRRGIAFALQGFLTVVKEEAELRRMNQEAAAAFATLQLISLDDVTPEVFAQDAIDRIEMERRERIAQIRDQERALRAAQPM